MDLVDQSLTPQISSLFSTPKKEEQTPLRMGISGSLFGLVCPPYKRALKVEECYKMSP